MVLTRNTVEVVMRARDEASPKIKRMRDNLKKVQRPFAGYALSIMFAGMAIQKTFQSIGKFGINTFKEINASMEGTSNMITELDGSMKFLGYTLGAALEPLLAFLIPYVDKLAVLIDDHPKWAAGITSVGFAVGSLLMILGMTKLAIDGLATSFALLTGATIGSFFTTVSANALMLSINLGLVAGSATVAQGALALLTASTIIGGIILAAVWVYKLGESIGGLSEMISSFARGMIRVVVFIWQFLLSGVLAIVNGIIVGMNEIIRLSNKLTGTKIGTMNLIETPDLVNMYADWEIDSFLKPKSYGQYGGLLPDMNNQGQTNNYYINSVETKQSWEEVLKEIQNQTSTNISTGN